MWQSSLFLYRKQFLNCFKHYFSIYLSRAKEFLLIFETCCYSSKKDWNSCYFSKRLLFRKVVSRLSCLWQWTRGETWKSEWWSIKFRGDSRGLHSRKLSTASRRLAAKHFGTFNRSVKLGWRGEETRFSYATLKKKNSSLCHSSFWESRIYRCPTCCVRIMYVVFLKEIEKLIVFTKSFPESRRYHRFFYRDFLNLISHVHRSNRFI